jgi:hypothetical protein
MKRGTLSHPNFFHGIYNRIEPIAIPNSNKTTLKIFPSLPIYNLEAAA